MFRTDRALRSYASTLKECTDAAGKSSPHHCKWKYAKQTEHWWVLLAWLQCAVCVRTHHVSVLSSSSANTVLLCLQQLGSLIRHCSVRVCCKGSHVSHLLWLRGRSAFTKIQPICRISNRPSELNKWIVTAEIEMSSEQTRRRKQRLPHNWQCSYCTGTSWLCCQTQELQCDKVELEPNPFTARERDRDVRIQRQANPRRWNFKPRIKTDTQHALHHR